MGDRHQFRAKWHDYNGGIYFVTICSFGKKHIFGRILDSQFMPSELGTIIDDCIRKITEVHPNIEVWNYVIMPNHIHMVIAVGAQYIAPVFAPAESKVNNTGCLSPPRYGEPVEDYHFNSRLAVCIRTFKAAVTRYARERCIATKSELTDRAQCIAPLQVWQRNYHEHIIRNQRAYDNIMNYIDKNIENWNKDRFYE